MQDLQLVFSQNPTTGQLILSLPLTSQGSLATVSGPARMVQRVIRYFLTPRGSLPYDPSYGNPLFALLGTPAARDASQWLTWLRQAEYEFLTRQTQDLQAGQLATDETVAAISGEQVGFPTPFLVTLAFSVQSQAGVAYSLPAPLYYALPAAS
jgi:hypothetical protein